MNLLRRMYRNETTVPFAKLWKPVGICSLLILIISVSSLGFRGLNLGLEFEGGGAWELPASGIEAEEVRDALRPLGIADARIQTGGDVLRVRTELSKVAQSTLEEGKSTDPIVAQVTAVLAKITGQPESSISVSTAGPSWGEEITQKAINALIVFFIVIALYITIRLRWEMAVGALLAVAHDILITVGLYALFQFEVTPPTVIAFLTIMGYSLYDTLVVFDKVRDNEHLVTDSKLTYTSVVERALNQVFMRSVNTSITSILPVVSVLIVGSGIMGAVTLREFALALLIGLIIGTFSSLFVASPIATVLRIRFGDSDSDSNRSYRLSEAVRKRSNSNQGAPSVPSNPAIPPRPRKKRK
ncbi:MAG: protein translocase subunit SecF [Acidimicrobiaceae bacterium]|nr:protein translocase subunit SecF [Acidimicrobiaceae bacterium]